MSISHSPLAGDFSIGEVSARTQVSTITLRAWERRYNLLNPARDSLGKRRYSSADLERIEQIKKWTRRGLPLGRISADWLSDAPYNSGESRTDAIHDALRDLQVHRLYQLLHRQRIGSDDRASMVRSWSLLAAQIRLMLNHRRNHYSLLYSALSHSIGHPAKKPEQIVLVLTTRENYELCRLFAQLFSLNSPLLLLAMFCAKEDVTQVTEQADADGYLLDRELCDSPPDPAVPILSFCCSDRIKDASVSKDMASAYEAITRELSR